jgi:hypothetical protein
MPACTRYPINNDLPKPTLNNDINRMMTITMIAICIGIINGLNGSSAVTTAIVAVSFPPVVIVENSSPSPDIRYIFIQINK